MCEWVTLRLPQLPQKSDWPESHKPVYILTHLFENTRCQHMGLCLWVTSNDGSCGFFLVFCGYQRCCGVAREHCSGVSFDRHVLYRVSKHTNSTKEADSVLRNWRLPRKSNIFLHLCTWRFTTFSTKPVNNLCPGSDKSCSSTHYIKVNFNIIPSSWVHVSQLKIISVVYPLPCMLHIQTISSSLT